MESLTVLTSNFAVIKRPIHNTVLDLGTTVNLKGVEWIKNELISKERVEMKWLRDTQWASNYYNDSSKTWKKNEQILLGPLT